MSEIVTVKLSPNRSNIMYVERRRIDLETDFSESLSILKVKQKDTLRVITPHAQYERGKVIGLGVLVYIIMFVIKKKI